MTFRKICAFVMAVVMVFSILPVQLFAVATDLAANEGDQGENTLLMKYDDRLEVSELGMTGAPAIENKEIKSKKVCSDEADDAVVVYVDGKLIAVGVGTAQVTWGTGENAVSYEITVEPATISVLLVTGQSLAAGTGGDKAESVVCEDGQVYCTNEGPKYNFTLCEGKPTALTVKAKDVTGLGIGYGSENKPARIDALTEAGEGTRALDGALAYQWHKLSGEKVWILNAAKGSTSLQTWQRGGYNYRHAVELFKAASAILNNEHLAGHYNVNRMGVVNYTTANGDEIWPIADYKTAFNSMWDGFREEFALYDLDGDGETDTVDCIGVVPTWLYLRTFNEWEDLMPEPLAFYNPLGETYTGKVLNYYMSAFEKDGVMMASTVSRHWTTDADVKAYFKENPVENMYGVLQNGNEHTSPTVVKDGVSKDGGHFVQLGYNVQGIDIANNMYAYWTGNNALQSVRLLQEDGITEVPESIEVPLNRSYIVVPETVPSTAKLTYEVIGDAAYYDHGFIRGNYEGDAVLRVMDTAGNVQKTVNVTVTKPVAKEDYKWYAWDFTTPSLTNTAGSDTDNTVSLHASAVPDTDLQSGLTGGVLDLTSSRSTLKMSVPVALDTSKAWSVELVAQAKSSDDPIGTFLATSASVSASKFMYINEKGDLMLAIKSAFTADDGTAVEAGYTYFKVSDEDFAKSKLASNFDISQEHKYELRCAGGIISYWLDDEKVGDLALSEHSLDRGNEAKHYTSKQPDYNGENFNSMTVVYWGAGSKDAPYSQGLLAKVRRLAIYAGSEMLDLRVLLSAIPPIDSIAIRPGDQITLPAPDTSDYCAKFVCWSENYNGDGATYKAGDVYTVSSDGSVILYAIWDDSAGIGADHEYDNPCEDTDCNSCGTTRVPPHVYENPCDTHCNECGTTRVPPHVYANACDVDCNECGAVRTVPAHVYTNVCDAHCNECGAVRIVPDHVYDNDLDTDCNVCGFERYDAAGFTGDCIWYLKGTVLTISGSGAMGDYTATDKAPWGTAIKEVILEEGVTSIGTRAFNGLTALTSIALPNTVETIGSRAFYGCALTSITIPDAVTTIGTHAFNKCSSLASVILPNAIKTIDSAAFANCTGLTVVWYEGSVSDQEDIDIMDTNAPLTAATWHYVDNACDTTCSECSETRTTDHVYNNACDTDCNVCGEKRTTEHVYANACDADCNECGAQRDVPDHVYDDDKDKDCNECGAVRITYTPGDLDGKEGVTSDDAIHLLYYVLLGEDRYPVNQPVDFDQDNDVDSDDAIYLLYYVLLGEDRYPI